MAVARPPMSEAEFMRLPDDGRKYELVDGEPKEVPTTIEHDVIGANIVAALMPPARGRGFVTISQAGFRMRTGNVRAPDVAFTRKERFPGGKPPRSFADAAPDLAIEIISPSEDRADMDRKVQEYFGAGAEQVWHLFPEVEEVRVFTSPSEWITYRAGDELDAGDLLPGFRCRVADLFALE